MDVLAERAERAARSPRLPEVPRDAPGADVASAATPATRRAALLVLPLAVAVALIPRTGGLYGVLWCYPAVMFSYVVLPPRLAGACNVLLLAAAAVAVDRYAGPGAAVRLACSLAAVIAIVTIMLNRHAGLQRTLAEQAITDPLTGAFNRRHLDVCLATAIARRQRTGERSSLLVFDVDRFKEINDTVGHPAGDHVLKTLVALVAQRARKVDVLFRIGGEEFALLLSGARFADALSVAENLRALVAAAPLLDGRQVSISVGVSELRDGRSAEGWIEEADAALYDAKQSGRNRVAGRLGRHPGSAPHGFASTTARFN